MAEGRLPVSLETTQMTNSIAEVLNKKLGEKFIKNVIGYINWKSEEQVAIEISCSNERIGGVRGKTPQLVSLSLNMKSMDLLPRQFGFDSDVKTSVHILPNRKLESEKHITYKEIKVPFRKPKKTREDVLACIGRFCDNYVKVLNDNKNVLMYQDLVDYNELLTH